MVVKVTCCDGCNPSRRWSCPLRSAPGMLREMRCCRPCCDRREGRSEESFDYGAHQKQKEERFSPDEWGNQRQGSKIVGWKPIQQWFIYPEELDEGSESQNRFHKNPGNPEGEISISDAISKIIEPYRDAAQDYKSFHKLVTVACAAWNATILPVEKRESLLADMRKLMPDQQSREDFTEIVKELMKRKNKLYPKANRMIIQFKVTNRKNDFHIAIASTMENKETAK